MIPGANGQPVELVLIGGQTVEVDAEIAPLVAALNAGGFETVASCCGHGFRPATVALADGREIIIARDFAEARKIGALFPLDINGEVAASCDGHRMAKTPESGLGRSLTSAVPSEAQADAQNTPQTPPQSVNQRG